MISTSYLSTVLVAFAAFATSTPTARTVYPEVIPGPGLPSLVSLGLTVSPPILTLPCLTRKLLPNTC
jgi:hypothetical protein